eukprot:420668-Ditylum_brightwellii.AAC.1
MALADRLLLQDFSCQAKLLHQDSGITCWAIKITIVNKAPQDVAAALAPVGGQEQNPKEEPEGKINKEDNLQEKDELEEVEIDGKLPAAISTTSLNRDSNDELGASAENILPHLQDGLSKDPTPHQCCAWAKEGGMAAHNKGPKLSKKPIPAKKCKKEKWIKYGETMKNPVPEGWDKFSLCLHLQHDSTVATSSGNGGELQESQDDEEKLK